MSQNNVNGKLVTNIMRKAGEIHIQNEQYFEQVKY
jgi:hypothetical protein